MLTRIACPNCGHIGAANAVSLPRVLICSQCSHGAFIKSGRPAASPSVAREQLHARITATMEGQFPEIVEAQPEVLARHSAEAGSVEKAVGYSLKAGQQAIARWAMTEAVAQLRKGLDLLSGTPDDAARQERELDLQIELGRALFATKGYAAPEAGEAFARARQLCELLNQPPRLEVLIGQFEFRMGRGELQQAEHHAEGMYCVGHAMT